MRLFRPPESSATLSSNGCLFLPRRSARVFSGRWRVIYPSGFPRPPTWLLPRIARSGVTNEMNRNLHFLAGNASQKVSGFMAYRHLDWSFSLFLSDVDDQLSDMNHP
jgi:hypothetical protein